MAMDSEDGQVFVKNLAHFVRTHEKALAQALLLQRQNVRNGHAAYSSSPSSPGPSQPSSLLAHFNFRSSNLKPAKLTLTPHHLFYLLSRFEELGISVGQMNVRLENIHADASPTNYVSFLDQSHRKGGRGGDRDSIHSVSSVRSVMSSMTSFWSTFGLSDSTGKAEKQKLATKEDLRYLYSAFTKIPCLRLAPDHRARLISGYEEFPFDTAVPLFAFKNISTVEIYDVDFRQFYGWDRLADQVKSLTVKRAGVDDPGDVIVNVVLDDLDKRRRRSAKSSSPSLPVATLAASSKSPDLSSSNSLPTSPMSPDRRFSAGSPAGIKVVRTNSISKARGNPRQRSTSPHQPQAVRHGSSASQAKTSTRLRRSSGGSSGSSLRSNTPRGSSSNLLATLLPPHKWRFLRHLSLADNGMTNVSEASLIPLATTLQSFDLSCNLFTEIPDTLATLTSLRALNMSSCMIQTLHSLIRNPIPAISTLNLRGNRLVSLAGIERLPSLERVDLRDNNLADPTELARLTGIPDLKEIFVSRNPFVKSHSNYRVTIFNLFRKTPGYTEDILIDSTGPGYSERKQLVDRAPEVASVPVVRLPVADDPPRLNFVAPQQSVGQATALDEAVATPIHAQMTGDDVVSSRRKRRNQRRIVELSQHEYVAQDRAVSPSPQIVDDSASAHLVAVPTSESLAGEADTKTELVQPVDPVTGKDFSVPSDIYRKKIEALRTDHGPDWLNALGNEGWQTSVQKVPLEASVGSHTPSAASNTS